MTAEDLIRSFEGCKLDAYLDIAGIPTIGFGHTGKEVTLGLTWTQAQADDALQHDIAATQALIALYSPGLQGDQLTAITDFVYNLGIGNYRSSTLCKCVNAQTWDAAKGEIVKWDHSHGVVIPGLLRRREAEAALL